MSRPTACRPGRPWLLSLVTAIVITGLLIVPLAGCAEVPQVRAGQPSVAGPPDVRPEAAAASSPALAAEKKRAGLPDCPVSSAVAPVVHGLPDLTLPCLGGGRSTRLAGLRGTPLVINIWGQWCAECRAEAPMLAAVSRQLGGRVRFLGIDYNDPRPDLAIDFARQAGWRYPQLFDQDRRITDALQLPAAAPQTIFVAPDGTITHRNLTPYASAERLRSDIATHLGVAP